MKPGESVVAALLGPGVLALGTQFSPDSLDAWVARTSPAELSRHEREVGKFYRLLWRCDGVPYPCA